MKSKNTKVLIFCLVIVLFVASGEFLLWQKKIATTKMVKNIKMVPAAKQQNTSSTSIFDGNKIKIGYRNEQYGFSFSLPLSWDSYSIIKSTWDGDGLDSAAQNIKVASGPLISIRHPQWTKKNPRQDIPVMIFTISQWNDLQADKFHIGAAPIGPSELGRNAKYVFALPARYNFAFSIGYEEVEEIINSKTFKAF